MSDVAKTGFIPKWLSDVSFDENEPAFQAGSLPDSDPRVVTRLVPKDHGHTLLARTVSKVIDLKQDLAFYSARDVAEGPNPAFADLTSLTKPLRESATLTLEPASPGSFVISACLPTRSKSLNANDVIARYSELLFAIDDNRKAGEVSLGALQVCSELARLLRRDVEVIEVTTYDHANALQPTYRITSTTDSRLEGLLLQRRATSRQFEPLTGRLEALDLGKNEFQLKIDGHRKRVRGSAAFFSLTSIRDKLGDTITLEGEVVRDRKTITMTAYRVVDAAE